MRYIANPVEVDAFKIEKVLTNACASFEAGIVCGQPEKAHTKAAAKGDVGMDHDFVSDGLVLVLEDGRSVLAEPGMTSRMTPVEGDYWVIQLSDGYTYLNPKAVFERKYSIDPSHAARIHKVPVADGKMV